MKWKGHLLGDMEEKVGKAQRIVREAQAVMESIYNLTEDCHSYLCCILVAVPEVVSAVILFCNDFSKESDKHGFDNGNVRGFLKSLYEESKPLLDTFDHFVERCQGKLDDETLTQSFDSLLTWMSIFPKLDFNGFVKATRVFIKMSQANRYRLCQVRIEKEITFTCNYLRSGIT